MADGPHTRRKRASLVRSFSGLRRKASIRSDSRLDSTHSPLGPDRRFSERFRLSPPWETTSSRPRALGRRLTLRMRAMSSPKAKGLTI